jgi:outer membrane protein
MHLRLILFFATLGLLCAPARATDLLQAYQLAKEYDATIAAARFQFQAEHERVPQGLAGLLPVISAQANTNMNEVNNRTSGNSTRYNDHGWSVGLTQPIFRYQNIVQYGQAGYQFQQAEAVYLNAEQELILRVAEAYFDVLAAEDALAFIRAEKTSISEQLAQAKRNFEVGTATITDTNEAQARYDLSVAQEIAAINALEIARRTLEEITATLITELAQLRTDLQLLPPQPNDMNLWVDSALNNNLAVRANIAALEVASREIERQRAGHFPTVDLIARYQDQTQPLNEAFGRTSRQDVDGTLIGLEVNLPLFAGGIVNSRTRAAVALRDRARANLDAARRSAQFEARQSFLNVNNGRAQVLALEQALKSSETALQSNRVGYEVGVRINIDVLNAQQQVFETQRDLARARYDTIINGLRLKAAAGTLNEADVVEVNRLLSERTTPAPSTAPPAP